MLTRRLNPLPEPDRRRYRSGHDAWSNAVPTLTVSTDTIPARAERGCATCQTRPEPDVFRSGGGFYVGRWCRCGPFSRDSDYYEERPDAARALAEGNYGRT